MEKKEVTNNQSEQLENNSFINLAKEVYNIATKNEEEIITLPKKRNIFKFKSDEVQECNNNKLDDDIEQFIKTNFNEDEEVSFSTIWKYCQFLRWVEKTCFYHNDLTKSIVCDSPMYSDDGEKDKRILVIQTSDVIIRLELEIAKSNSSILDLDSIDKIFNRIMTIEVKRKYGKLMSNKFIVIDARTTIRDSSDEYLLKTINKIVKDGIETQFRSILQFIKTREFLEEFKFKE